MDVQSQLPAWREQALLGLRWFLLVLFSAALYLARAQAGAAEPFAGLLLVLMVGIIVNAVLTAVVVLRVDIAIMPAVVIGDLALIAAFAYVGGTHALIIAGLAGSLMLSGILRLSFNASGIQVAGLLSTIVVVLALVREPSGQTILSDPRWMTAIPVLIGLGAVAVTAAYAIEHQFNAQAKRIQELARGETEEMLHLREHSQAIYRLATTVSSTLDYDTILNAVLDAGRLALRDGESQLLVSAVLLFRASDNALHVAASRRMTRADQNVIIMGTQGVIGQTLREAAPVFAENVKKDPELQYFTSFQHCRSYTCVPLRSGFDSYGVLLYGSESNDAFDEDQAELLTAISSQVTVALQNAVLYRSLREEKERIVEVEEDARKKLARDLHDGPTQSVSAIAMRMNYIYRLLEKDPKQVPDELKRVEDLARRTAKEIRHMLFTLRPLVLETQGLTAALVQLAEKMQETHGQAVAVRMARDIDPLIDAHQQGVLFYIIEEAVNNARKHAQAELITVTIGRQEDMIVCQIADNGIGFDTAAVNTNYEKRGSLGMVNMRERVELLEGTMRIDSVPGKGTGITIYIPPKGAHNLHRDDGRQGRPLTKLALAAIERSEAGMREQDRPVQTFMR